MNNSEYKRLAELLMKLRDTSRDNFGQVWLLPSENRGLANIDSDQLFGLAFEIANIYERRTGKSVGF